jgi:hypothetical protein
MKWIYDDFSFQIVTVDAAIIIETTSSLVSSGTHGYSIVNFSQYVMSAILPLVIENKTSLNSFFQPMQWQVMKSSQILVPNCDD